MSAEPLVSILMNCYNGEKFLREAIESVLEQTYQNWELIFWDNQSTDRSAEIFKSYNDSRLNYFYAPTHTLLYEARNYAAENASGDYVAFLDVDDYWAKKKLENQMYVFSKNSNVAMVYSNYYFKNEIKNTEKKYYKKNLPEGNIVDHLLRQHVVGLLTMVINRNYLPKNESMFDPRLHNIGDFDVAIKVCLNNKVACVQQPLATYRWHGNNETVLTKDRHIKELERWGNEMQLCQEVTRYKGFKIFLNDINYLKAMLLVMKGESTNAFKYLLTKLPFHTS